MTSPVQTVRPHPHPALTWLRLPAHPFDIFATLSQALGAAWFVQRQTDPEGEVSIFAMAAGDEDNVMPTFMLYEQDGLAYVATVQDDEWRTQPGFVSAQAAVAAIVADIACLPMNMPAVM